jgi:hypothetical protein
MSTSTPSVATAFDSSKLFQEMRSSSAASAGAAPSIAGNSRARMV